MNYIKVREHQIMTNEQYYSLIVIGNPPLLPYLPIW